MFNPKTELLQALLFVIDQIQKYNIFSYKLTLHCLFTSGQSEQQCYSSVYRRTSECWLLRCPSGKFASVRLMIFEADINLWHLRLRLPLNHHLLNCDAYCSPLLHTLVRVWPRSNLELTCILRNPVTSSQLSVYVFTPWIKICTRAPTCPLLGWVLPGCRFCCSSTTDHYGLIPNQNKSPLTPIVSCPKLKSVSVGWAWKL